MKSLKAFGSNRDDMNIFLDDAVEVILKTPKHSYYQFAVNPNGALLDIDRGGLETWDSDATAAAVKGADSWTLEICIPLEDIDGDKPSAEKPWNLNVCRSRVRDAASELSIFVPAGPPRPTFHNTGKMATLIVK